MTNQPEERPCAHPIPLVGINLAMGTLAAFVCAVCKEDLPRRAFVLDIGSSSPFGVLLGGDVPMLTYLMDKSDPTRMGTRSPAVIRFVYAGDDPAPPSGAKDG
jgi:hypothetical protein